MLDEVYKGTTLPYSTVADLAGSIEDEARIGRPVSSANDKNTLEETTLVEEDPNMTLVQKADAVGISTGTAQATVMSVVEKF